LENIELYCEKSTSSSTAEAIGKGAEATAVSADGKCGTTGGIADPVRDGKAAAERTSSAMGGTGVSVRGIDIGAEGVDVVAAAESNGGTVEADGRGSCGVMRRINGANDG
jgi:hypothetical protein